jgi:uncharacterized protein YggE
VKPDTITVRVIEETELDADSADLTVVIEGSKVFSGSEAFRKAKEVRELIDSLKEVGLEESRIKMRSVEVNSQSFALIKTSSAKYTLTIKTVSLEFLPSVLTTVSSHKGAHLSRLNWNYSRLKETRSRLRQEAIRDALAQAQLDANALGVQVLGIHELHEETRGRDYNPEYVTADSLSDFGVRQRHGGAEIGFQLGNSTTVSLDLRAEFRVSPIAEARSSDVSGGGNERSAE